MAAPLNPDQIKARGLITDILRDVDWVIPELARLITDDALVPGPGQVDPDDMRLATFLGRMNDLLTNVIDLRLLSRVQRDAS